MSQFALLVATSAIVGKSPKRTHKIEALANCLRALAVDEIQSAVLFLSGELPQGKIGIGIAAVRAANAVPPSDAPQLTIMELDSALSSLAGIKGSGSAAERLRQLGELFARCTEVEQDFLFKLLLGELRQGALAGVMVDAIAQAASLPLDEVRRAAMYAPHLGTVARTAIHEDRQALLRYQLTTLSPVAPMLAETAADVAEALGQLGEAAFEWKIDGARIQVHKLADQIRIYTRNLNDVAASLPEVIELISGLLANELVLDGEVVALGKQGQPLPFQMTMRRFGRKLEVETLRTQLPLHAYFFDCLKLDGQSLADRPTQERIAALNSVIPEENRMPRIVTSDLAKAEAFYADALGRGHEGIMAKSLNAPYEAGKRGASWLKIKRAHTLDLVILAAERGSGRRARWLSNLHLGARDASTGEFVMLGKTFKGLTDAMLEWQTAEFPKHEVRRDDYTVYLKPAIVAEIAFNDIQASSQYPGGYALRFARVKRYRFDKKPEEADTIETVRKLYGAQSGVEAR